MATPVISSEPSPQERFSANVKELSCLIHGIVVKAHKEGYPVINPLLVELASGMIEFFDKRTLIEGFIIHSHEFWPLIKQKEASFFVNHAHVIFQDLPVGHVDDFKKLFTLKTPQGQSIVDKEDIEELWSFFGSLVKISIKHVHQQRVPQTSKVPNGVIYRYTVNYIPEVDVGRHASMWEVRLDFPMSTS